MTPAHAAKRPAALSRTESVVRLRAARVGRVVISVRCLPAARLVRVAVVNDALYLGTTEAAVIEAADRGDVVTLQIDGLESDGSTWSVEVTGRASRTSPPGPPLEWAEQGLDILQLPLTVVHGDRTPWRDATSS